MARLENNKRSEYKMFSKGPSKSLKCLRYFLRNPDATARQGADACDASYNVAWATITDIKNATIAGTRDELVEVAGVSAERWNPSQQEFDLLDAITSPKLDAPAVAKILNDNTDLVDELLANDKVLEALQRRTVLAELNYRQKNELSDPIPRIRSKDYIPDQWDTKASRELRSRKLEMQERVLRGRKEMDDAAGDLRAALQDVEHDWEEEVVSKVVGEGVSDGSTASYYVLPKGATQLQDLISHKNMNAQVGEIFRACYRYGQSSHSDELRDAKKILFYIEAELRRLGGWDL
tara:strand:+ start:134 stop:1009 length:876 start_codon:yes stop_codon:yes gene_type:complete